MIPGNRSVEAFYRAQTFIPGGVNSPVRAFRSVGGTPIFIDHAKGSRIFDIDGNSFVDFVCSWGPLILGHAPSQVIKAINRVAEKGTTFGAPTELETELAEKIVKMVPSIEKVRFVNSGTEATMTAIRLARGYTGRSLVVKFEGCYHGHADLFLSKAGSGLSTLGLPESPGVTGATAGDTVTLSFNDAKSFVKFMSENGDKTACVIVEPIPGNMGVVLPESGFLETLRSETKKHGAVLIFDEVISGFRVATGGAQELFGIKPDITTLGKIVGGGLPAAAFGGKKEIMAHIAPDGPVYQAGTLSGNPLAMAAGLATLEETNREGFYGTLEDKSAFLCEELKGVFENAGIAAQINRVGSMMTIFFSAAPVKSYSDATKSNNERFVRWHKGMLIEGVYLAPSRFEAMFLSSAHSAEDIAFTIEAARKVSKTL